MTKTRAWVNSEKFPLFPWDGFRVLSNGTIYTWKKWKWIFGKWDMRTRTEDEVAVLDEASIR